MEQPRPYQIEKIRRLDRHITVMAILLFLAVILWLGIDWSISRREWLIFALPISGFFVYDAIRLAAMVCWHILAWRQAFVVLLSFLPILVIIGLMVPYPRLYWSNWPWFVLVGLFILYANIRWMVADRRMRRAEDDQILDSAKRNSGKRS
jgi:TRAP-type C4-dicarboxylate transport system permease small subunit